MRRSGSHARSLSAGQAMMYQPFRLPPSPEKVPTSPVEPTKSPSSKKPHMRRGHSHKIDPFLSIRQAFTSMLPEGWQTQQELHQIAKSCVAVSVGLFPAYVIRNFPLDRFGTECLAMSLDELTATDQMSFILDIKSKTLILAHSGLLTERINSFPLQDETTFLSFYSGMFHRIAGESLAYMSNALALLSQSLSNSLTRVIQIGDENGQHSPLQTPGQMSCFSEWVIGSPVAYVSGADAFGLSDADEGGADLEKWMDLKTKNRRLIQVLLEGVDAKNDHVLDLAVPKDLFHLDSLTEMTGRSRDKSKPAQTPFEEPLSYFSPAAFTFREIQNRLESQFFTRLNESASASRIWSDISVLIAE